jgi:hypothetical protein
MTPGSDFREERAEMVLPFLDARIGSRQPVAEWLVVTIQSREENSWSGESEIEIGLHRCLFVVGEAGTHRIEVSPRVGPGTLVSSALPGINRRVGKDRDHKRGGRVEHAPAQPGLIIEIHAELKGGGLPHHPGAGGAEA